jgi:hypothetical protein
MFQSMTVKTRLLLGFLVVALLGAAVAGIGIFNMAAMNAQAEQAYESDLIGVSSTKEANINLIYIGRATAMSCYRAVPKSGKNIRPSSTARARSCMRNWNKHGRCFAPRRPRPCLPTLTGSLPLMN